MVSNRETIGIIGPSGSGKSTLLNIIALLENPTFGDIEISGVDCNILRAEEKSGFLGKKILDLFSKIINF